MSKSKGNVVDPLNIVEQYGADTLRTYVLFMGEYGAAIPWSESSLKGCKRFLDRVAQLADSVSDNANPKLESSLHKAIKKVSEDIESMKYNTAVAALMIFMNDAEAEGTIGKEQYMTFLKLLTPFAPHLCEEIWSTLGGKGFISVSEWPAYDESKLVDDSIDIGVQINGKLRATVSIPTDCDEATAVAEAMKVEKIADMLKDKQIIKTIYRANKILSFVVK